MDKMGFDFDFNLNFDFGDKEKKRLDFFDLCELAGYPRPFQKQIEMKDFLIKTQGVHLLLGSRGYGKTDYAVIMGSAEAILNNPNFKILLIAKELSRGQAIVKEVREVLVRAGVKFKNKSEVVLRTTGCVGKDPNMESLSVKSSGLRGRHPNLVIMEDPITPKDASEAERLAVKKTYEEVCKLTMNVGIVGQPVHKLDLYQALRDIVPTKLMKYGEIPELDPDIDAQRAAGVDEFSIQASYFLNIMDDLKMPFSLVKEVDFAAKETICWIDPSHKGRDYTAIVCGGRNLSDFVLTGFCFEKAWYDCTAELLEINKIMNISHTVIETNGLGDLPVNELRKQGMPCVGCNTTMNKYTKILNSAAFSPDLKLSRLNGLPPELARAQKIFIEQTKNYEYNSKHDDAPDAIASLIVYIRGL